MHLTGIKKLIKKNAVNHFFTCNVAIPWNGKEKIVPIPDFKVECYVIHTGKGDDSIKTVVGDVFTSSVEIFSLNPIGVFSDDLKKFITLGFQNTSFTLILGAQTYRIVSQKKSIGYYKSTGELNV